MYWDRKHETMGRSTLERFQLKRLKETFRICCRSERYAPYAALYRIGSLADLAMIPFTTKEDLRAGFPQGYLAGPLAETVRLHSSSGTTGNPTVVYHTKKDIATWADLMARNMYMAGLRRDDIFQNMMGYGLFTGGLGMHYGAERLGCLTIPIGPGNSKRQLWFLRHFGVTAAHILPSYAMHLHSFFDDECRPEDLKLRIVFVGAEPHTEEMRREIDRLYGVRAFNSYGLSEMCGPGVAFECPERNGLHLWEDHFLAEIVDPATGALLPEGEEGELVLTSLRREAMPLLRYRTRDLTRIIPGACSCGRTHRRIERIKGRSDDMLIINGVNIFPMQIEETLLKTSEVGRNYTVEIVKENFMDRIHVSVEMKPEHFSGTLAGLDIIQSRVASALKTELGVSVHVRLVEPGGLPVSEGKAKRIFDRRGG